MKIKLKEKQMWNKKKCIPRLVLTRIDQFSFQKLFCQLIFNGWLSRCDLKYWVNRGEFIDI